MAPEMLLVFFFPLAPQQLHWNADHLWEDDHGFLSSLAPSHVP